MFSKLYGLIARESISYDELNELNDYEILVLEWMALCVPDHYVGETLRGFKREKKKGKNRSTKRTRGLNKGNKRKVRSWIFYPDDDATLANDDWEWEIYDQSGNVPVIDYMDFDEVQ